MLRSARGLAGPAGEAGAPGWGEVISGPGDNFGDPVALTFDGRYIWAAGIGDTVTELNASDGSVVLTLSAICYHFNQPMGMAFGGHHMADLHCRRSRSRGGTLSKNGSAAAGAG